MCRKYSPTTELPSLKLAFLHLNKKWWKWEDPGSFWVFQGLFSGWKTVFFWGGGVSGGFKYFPFSPLEKINPASVKNHLGPMRIAIYEEHIAIFYSVAYCPTKTPTVYRCKKNICIYYVIVEQVNKIIFEVFSQPLTPHFLFERFFSVEKQRRLAGATNGVRSVVLGFILRLRDFMALRKGE